MKFMDKYFLNSLRYASSHAALRLGAYNTAYALRGSARPSPIFLLPLVAKTSHMLKRYVKFSKLIVNINLCHI